MHPAAYSNHAERAFEYEVLDGLTASSQISRGVFDTQKNWLDHCSISAARSIDSGGKPYRYLVSDRIDECVQWRVFLHLARPDYLG